MHNLRRVLLTLLMVVAVVTPVLAQQADNRFDIPVTEEMIRHSRILDILYFAGFAYGIVVLLVVLLTRVSARMRDAAARVTPRPFLLAMLYMVLFTIVTA